jgi:hypothetical protein
VATVNLVGQKFDPPFDRDLFLDDDEIQPILDTDTTMAHLLARIGKFSSVGEGRRNGWDRPVPTGWNHFIIGKGPNRWDIYIHNPTHTMQEWINEFHHV